MRMWPNVLLSVMTVCMGMGASYGAPAPWQHPLSYDAGGYWTVRAPVEIENVLDAALDGTPVAVTVRADDGTAGLIGAVAASVRVVAASGNELLFDLQDSVGSLKRSGKVAAGDVISLPAEAQPKAKTTVFIYAGNESAWLPPDWLRAGLVNAGFENGADAPDGWQVWGVDDKHKMSRQKGGAHTGDWCARCEVAEGAERTWVKYSQGGIPVIAGQKYRLTAWVKAQSVKGRAGWYVHVDGAKPQMVNRTEGWEGTYDWRQMTIAFDVPEGGQTFSCGTLLHGTGTAWFDDVKLEMLGAAGAVKAKVLPAETMMLRPVGETFSAPADKEWPFRVPLRIRNFTDADMPQAVVSLDVRRVRNRVAKLIGFTAQPGVRIVDPQSPDQPLAYAGSLTEDLRLTTSVPAKSEKVVWLYVSQNAQAPGRSPQAKFEDWAAGKLNMTPNGDMEDAEGERPKAWTTGEEGRTGEQRFSAKRVSGGLRGQWCLELNVPATVKDPGWAGWRQKVPVKPQTRYLLAGHVKTKGVDGQVSIHGHFRKADGTHTER
ncbi:MAG: hypothetical protein FJ272_13765, partial [Planctomycetes bacterium]|nr:hypothetical protein [Planctomycetota bacterium]